MQRLWQVGTHSCASIVLCYILVPYKPDALAALGVVGGLSLPEVLHYATCTLSFSPPFEHLPTSPNHEITPSSLEVVSIDDFRSAKISEKRKPKCRRRNQNCVSVRRRTLAILPHIPLVKRHFRESCVGRSGATVVETKGNISLSNPIKRL